MSVEYIFSNVCIQMIVKRYKNHLLTGFRKLGKSMALKINLKRAGSIITCVYALLLSLIIEKALTPDSVLSIKIN